MNSALCFVVLAYAAEYPVMSVILSSESADLLDRLAGLSPAQIDFLHRQALRSQQQQQRPALVATPELPVVGTPQSRKQARRSKSTPASSPAHNMSVNRLGAQPLPSANLELAGADTQMDDSESSTEGLAPSATELAKLTGRGSLFFVSTLCFGSGSRFGMLLICCMSSAENLQETL